MNNPSYLCWLFKISQKCYSLKKCILWFFYHVYIETELVHSSYQEKINEMSMLILEEIEEVCRTPIKKYENRNIK